MPKAATEQGKANKRAKMNEARELNALEGGKTDLSPKQQKFISVYVETGNASHAARKAGYSVATAGQIAAALLKNVKVKAEVDRLFAENGMSPAEAVANLAQIARANPADFLDSKGRVSLAAIRKHGRVLDGVEKTKDGHRITLAGKIPALTLICKVHGLLVDKQEISGNGVTGNLAIEINLTKSGSEATDPKPKEPNAS